MSDYHFTLPCYIKDRGKNVGISLNWYRNAHYQISNRVKVEFKRLIKPQFEGLGLIDEKVKIKFVYYAARNNSPDLDNFTSIVKKFFQDACVELELLAEDNVNYIPSTSEYYGGIDKENPRVEAFITKLN